MLEQLKNRRSIRRYRDQRVDKDKVDTILKAGLLAPSSRGRRPWEFVLVDDKKTLQTLSEARAHGSKFLAQAPLRSEEHTSELQSRPHLVCRLLLEKKKIKKKI